MKGYFKTISSRIPVPIKLLVALASIDYSLTESLITVMVIFLNSIIPSIFLNWHSFYHKWFFPSSSYIHLYTIDSKVISWLYFYIIYSNARAVPDLVSGNPFKPACISFDMSLQFFEQFLSLQHKILTGSSCRDTAPS